MQVELDVGAAAAQMLVARAVLGILATGDRVVWAPNLPAGKTYDGGEAYDRELFPRFSTNAQACLAEMEQTVVRGQSTCLQPTSAPAVPGEGPVRFASSRFKLLNAAQTAKWQMQTFEDLKFHTQVAFHSPPPLFIALRPTSLTSMLSLRRITST